MPNFLSYFMQLRIDWNKECFHMPLYSAHININLLYGMKLSMNKNAQKSNILPLLAISHWWIDISQKVTYFLIHLRTYDKNYAFGLKYLNRFYFTLEIWEERYLFWRRMIMFKELTVFKQIDSFPQIVSFMFGVSKFDQEMISNLSIADVHILSWQKAALKTQMLL